MDGSIHLTSSAALKDGDSGRGLAVALSVRGSTARHSGSLSAQPRHAVPRFEVENDQVVGFVIADMFDSVSSEGRKRRFVSGPTGLSAPRFR